MEQRARLQTEIKKIRRQLFLLYEIGNLMRVTLKFDEIVFLILSAVTSHEGLGFNRAVLFMSSDDRRELTGAFGIGPRDPKESAKVWQHITEKKLHLRGFIDVYRKADGRIDPELNALVQKMKVAFRHDAGVVGRVAVTEMPVVALDAAERRAWDRDPVVKTLGMRAFAAVPVRGKNATLGTLIVDNPTTGREITREDVANLCMLADHAGLAIENAHVFHHVLETSQKDSLTGLWNHAHFQELLRRSLSMSGLQKSPLSLVIFDVDDFKNFNDLLGHQEGDRTLRAIAQITRTVLRRNDYIARYGGEEFAVIFPGVGKQEAATLADKLREQVAAQTEGFFESDVIKKVTISVGVATFPEDAADREKLIYCADAALYEAKRAGKNKTELYRAV